MIGALYRATLEGDGPDSVVIKLPGLDETARFTAAILRLNIREVGFYRELADESPIRVPYCHFGAVDTETHQFVLGARGCGLMPGRGPRSRAWAEPTPSRPSTSWLRGTPTGGARPAPSWSGEPR